MKKLKVLHASMMRYPAPGISNQLAWERLAAERLGVPLDSTLFVSSERTHIKPVISASPSTSLWSRAAIRSAERKAYVKYLKSQEHKYDLLFLRWTTADPTFSDFILETSLPVVTVHHTIEDRELKLGGVKGFILAAYDDYLIRRSAKKLAGIVGVTEEILQYELQRTGTDENKLRLVYPNGIYWDSSLSISGKVGEKASPVFIFVASNFAPWHGLDLLLDTTLGISQSFVLHIVGGVDEQLRSKFSRDKRIIFHDSLRAEEITKLYEQADIGLSSFALERKGMEEACTLKVREYLRHGLPVFAGYKDVFPPEFPYFRRGNASLEEAINYYESLQGCLKSAVANESRQFIDKTELLRNLYSSLCSLAP